MLPCSSGASPSPLLSAWGCDGGSRSRSSPDTLGHTFPAVSGPLSLPSVHRSTSHTCPKAIKQINPPTEAERARLAGEGRRRQLQVDGCSCSSQVLRAGRRAGIVLTPHQGEADTKHTHAPLRQRQEKMLVNITMTSQGPFHPSL